MSVFPVCHCVIHVYIISNLFSVHQDYLFLTFNIKVQWIKTSSECSVYCLSLHSCTCSSYRNLFVVLHQEVLHHLSSLWGQTEVCERRIHIQNKINHWLPFGQPVQTWVSLGLSEPVTYLAEWKFHHHHPLPEQSKRSVASMWRNLSWSHSQINTTQTSYNITDWLVKKAIDMEVGGGEDQIQTSMQLQL